MGSGSSRGNGVVGAGSVAMRPMPTSTGSLGSANTSWNRDCAREEARERRALQAHRASTAGKPSISNQSVCKERGCAGSKSVRERADLGDGGGEAVEESVWVLSQSLDIDGGRVERHQIAQVEDELPLMTRTTEEWRGAGG